MAVDSMTIAGLGYGPEREIQEQRDDPERERDHDLEPRLDPLNPSY